MFQAIAQLAACGVIFVGLVTAPIARPADFAVWIVATFVNGAVIGDALARLLGRR